MFPYKILSLPIKVKIKIECVCKTVSVHLVSFIMVAKLLHFLFYQKKMPYFIEK